MPGEPLDFAARAKMLAEAAAHARDPVVGAQLRELSDSYAAIARSGQEGGVAAAIQAVLSQIIAANRADTHR